MKKDYSAIRQEKDMNGGNTLYSQNQIKFILKHTSFQFQQIKNTSKLNFTVKYF